MEEVGNEEIMVVRFFVFKMNIGMILVKGVCVVGVDVKVDDLSCFI